ncbi:RagB/SusD family nutrient uptake outer membrane protein [Bacteroides ovatus]|uniref:Starch-binding associating with outer membrane n=1 Tax=Bacteroides ovatus TaxID=28116 RepID=A0A1G8K0D9_BACOV|nr:RagB/SusD family nutrient uptake outer membrane protein [Bacteroides ovatus]SDI36853.1 Starch-binding associating with outer membrane [Bacteroides ovatus]
MKKYIYNSIIAALLTGGMLVSVGCDDYLSVVPKGEKIPTTVADFEALLRDEYGCHRTPSLQAIILMNDQYVSASNLSYYPLYKANYNWDETADRIAMNKSDEDTYYVNYSAISTCNLLIENVPLSTEGTEVEKKVLIAQARVLRAMSYFNLVNFYSDTYVASTAAAKGGVPLITSANINAAYTQPSVQGVYDFIMDDMKSVYNDLPAKSTTILHPDKATADAFYARLYLQMGNYTDALIYADKALQANDKLYDWTTFYEQYKVELEAPGNSTATFPSPMGFDCVENYNFRHGPNSYQTMESNLPVERMDRFETGDARMASRWKLFTSGNNTYYRSNLRGYYNYGGMTTVEVYLIKAECLARDGKYDDAMDVLNAVREKRILPATYQPLQAATEAEAMNYIMQTKNNELILTQVPFMDARRLNAEGKYPVSLSKEVGTSSLTLSPTSHLWTMPFPQGAVENPGNGTIIQNVSK